MKKISTIFILLSTFCRTYAQTEEISIFNAGVIDLTSEAYIGEIYIDQSFNKEKQDIKEEKDIYNNSDVTIYPNPTKKFLYLKSLNCKIEALKIFNNSGKIIYYKNKITDNRINIEQLSSGVYYIYIHPYNSQDAISLKFIKI